MVQHLHISFNSLLSLLVLSVFRKSTTFALIKDVSVLHSDTKWSSTWVENCSLIYSTFLRIPFTILVRFSDCEQPSNVVDFGGGSFCVLSGLLSYSERIYRTYFKQFLFSSTSQIIYYSFISHSKIQLNSVVSDTINRAVALTGEKEICLETWYRWNRFIKCPVFVHH